MTEYVQISTTTGDRAVAERIAADLVDRRMAACVQVSGPAHSTYLWRGAVETADEWVCTMKSLASRFDEVSAAIKNLHAYDVPEIIATPIQLVSDDYRDWLHNTLSPEG